MKGFDACDQFDEAAAANDEAAAANDEAAAADDDDGCGVGCCWAWLTGEALARGDARELERGDAAAADVDADFSNRGDDAAAFNAATLANRGDAVADGVDGDAGADADDVTAADNWHEDDVEENPRDDD
jgi:hypothetical protein